MTAHDIVVVGASAGGLEAFSQLLDALPADPGFAIVLVQHLAPQREGGLTGLLASRTALEVVEATEDVAVAPNHVYVVPPNVQMEFRDGHLHLLPRPTDRSQYTPIDHFFCSLADTGSIRIASVNPAAGRLVVTMSDTGAGISRAMLAGIFNPFEPAGEPALRAPGLGLGLATCKAIIEAHGGRITADSAGIGCGATFTIELATIAVPAATRPPEPVGRPAHRILLVEDNRDNATAIAELLRVHGHQVDVADSISAALERAKCGFDVLVSDIGLPDGTGRDLMRQLRSSGPVRGIALTGYGSDADVSNSMDAGFACHLTKPVDPDRLLAAIDELAGPRH